MSDDIKGGDSKTSKQELTLTHAKMESEDTNLPPLNIIDDDAESQDTESQEPNSNDNSDDTSGGKENEDIESAEGGDNEA